MKIYSFVTLTYLTFENIFIFVVSNALSFTLVDICKTFIASDWQKKIWKMINPMICAGEHSLLSGRNLDTTHNYLSVKWKLSTDGYTWIYQTNCSLVVCLNSKRIFHFLFPYFTTKKHSSSVPMYFHNTNDDVNNFFRFIICEMQEQNRLDITMKLQKKRAIIRLCNVLFIPMNLT